MVRDASRFYQTVGANINKYRKIRNYSLETLGEMIGVQKKTVQRYECGEIKIDMDRLHAIAKALNVDISKLLEGTIAAPMIESRIDDIVRLPVLGSVPAGDPLEACEEVAEYMALPRMLVKSENDFCLKIRGDSMREMGISDGDLILVHPQPTAENGQTIIARIDGEVTCKRFYRLNGKCRLEPANSQYKPIDCDELEIIGIVTKVIKDIY